MGKLFSEQIRKNTLSKGTQFRNEPTPFIYGRARAIGNRRPRPFPNVAPTNEGTGQLDDNYDSSLLENGPEIREQKAWDAGFREGESRARTQFEELLRRERESLNTAIRSFDGERKTYFQQLETEVVQLALAIARKILQREAQVDPLLLRGAVRVALDTAAAATELSLLVPPEEITLWREHLASEDNLQTKPQLVADPSLEPGQCVLETSLGTVDLDWKAQLKEVEEGFYDLLALRPRSAE